MKRNIKNFLVKAFSMCLAFILVFPTNLFAMGLDNTKSRKYNASASIMGLAQTDNTSQNDEEVTDQTLLETEITSKETDKYLIEKYARLSKTTGQIEYMIKVHPKDEESKDKVTTSFAISKNTDLKDLKIEKVSQVHSDNSQAEIKYQEQRPSILYNNDAFETLGVTTDKADLVYYLSAKLSEEALGKIDEKTPSMDLDINIAEAGANLYQDRYALSIDKMEVVGEDGEDTIETLKEKENPTHQVSAIYKEGSSNLLGENPGEITWTDYIHADDDKEFTTDIKLDEGQDATDSQIKVEFYQANEKGYTLKEDFTKEIPFTESLKLQIPLGFVAKVELTTKVTENKKEYSLNQTKIPNPIYKEEKTEERLEEDDADPLPEETSKTEESKGTSEEKIIPIDPETNEAVIDHSLVSEDNTEDTKSAINLNRDSVINNFKNNEKLNPVVEITINNISSLFNAYNNDEMTYEEFLASLRTQASDLSKEDFAEIVQGLIAGLNQETYKVANIDEDQLLAEVYGKEEAEEAKPATEEAPVTETKKADTEVTSNAETDINNVETETKEDFRTPEDKIKDNALESFDKALDQVKEESKKPQDDDKPFITNLTEGIKGIFGQSNFNMADKELKAALAEGKSLEEIQALLLDLGEKYELNRKDEARLMADNEDAIKGIIARDADQNFRPSILMAQNADGISSLNEKKFTIRTRFDASTVNGPIKAGQSFTIKLDDQLKVNNPSSLPNITNNGKVIATPEYDSQNKQIKYTIKNDITENISIPLNIDVDFDTTKIKSNEDINITNRISGIGVVDSKALPTVKLDKNGNPAGTIIEEGRDDVVQVIGEDDQNYKVNMDLWGEPAVEGMDIKGFNWTLTVDSDTDLKELGYKLNLTTVEGSGLGEIKDVKINGQSVNLEKQLAGQLGIVDSKHHSQDTPSQHLVYQFYTEVKNKQENYMIDLSTILTNKNNKLGAVRHILPEGYEKDRIERETPTRVSMNNRTTVLGQFANNTSANWTITDAVSTGDENNGLPLETRNVGNNQQITSGQRAVYGIDKSTGKMVVKNEPSSINSLPEKAQDPSGVQQVGNIAVYKVNTSLPVTNQPDQYSISGVSISKYRDLIVDQAWAFPEGYNGNLPKQTLTVNDNAGNQLGETTVKASSGKQRTITIPNVKYWDIDSSGKATMINHTLSQTFPEGAVSYGGENYNYTENANYYNAATKNHYIANSLSKIENKRSATFTVIKKDSNGKLLEGATFYLLGAEIEITTDAKGEATFTNIKPGTYYLREIKAPAGYKLDQEEKTITISDDGKVSVSGRNARFSLGSGKTDIVEHSDYPNWKDFMNTQHYGKINQDGKLEFYVYLKPYDQRVGGRTDKNTTFNISIPGLESTNYDVAVYDVYPDQRPTIFAAMNNQSVESNISTLGSNLINKEASGTETITGNANKDNPLTGEKNYQLYFPASRFGDNWGFLVKVSANIGNRESTSVNYDWLAYENPINQSKIQVSTNVSKNTDQSGHPTITISNEPLKRSEIEVAKFTNDFTADKRNRLPGAEFTLKNSNGRVIANKITDENGNVSFGEYPEGTYYLEETKAPEGYEKSNVYFVVTVDEKGQVTYKAKFKNSSSTPTPGVDYYIEREKSDGDSKLAIVEEVHQRMWINDKDNDPNQHSGIWDAYRLESLNYHLDAKLKNVSPGKRFEIQFDPNLDFTQYFKTFPDLYFQGKKIAEPYFNYKTNLLTYVFNENSKSHSETSVQLDLVGIIPSKFYATNSGRYDVTTIVSPNQTDSITANGSNPKFTLTVPTDYSFYDKHKKDGYFPSQTYYFRDVYKAEDGNWYVTAIAYYNPVGNTKFHNANKIWFNWKFTNWQGTAYNTWKGNGTEAPYFLEDVKIYKTSFPGIERKKIATLPTSGDWYGYYNKNMPLSMGIRPEQDPSTYTPVFSTKINPEKPTSVRQGEIQLTYEPDKITIYGDLHDKYNSPLTLTMPGISNAQEGYVIEQTFRIRDINEFNTRWRAFYMGNGEKGAGRNNRDESLNSFFVTGPNNNIAKADQTGVDLPTFAKEVVGIINKKYVPGSFKLTKLNEANQNEKLKGATFVLTDSDNNKIYRSSDSNGEISFNNLAPGKYTLKEYRAPNGYNKNTKEWDVTIYSDGYVKINSSSITGGGEEYTGKDNINIKVTNKPVGHDFVVYKKDKQGNTLADAEFTLTKQVKGGETPPDPIVKKSDANGLVKFEKLEDGTYILHESQSPAGYKPLDKKWVLIVDNGTKKIYTYSQSSDNKVKSILGEEGTRWVNVKERPTAGWYNYDNRWTGWVDNNQKAQNMGTRIVAINKGKKYVIQRYVINPEAREIQGVDGVTGATIHREKPEYPNMDWYKGDEEYKIYTLDGRVTGLISDLRLSDYNVTDITNEVTKEPDASHYGETRLKLKLPKTNKPIVIDVKVPYKEEYGGVGTGLDWFDGERIFWKSDYYERVSDIKESEPTTREEGSIIGSYVGEGSLDVENELRTYGFKIKKVKEGSENQIIQGALFKLTGPDDSHEERKMTTGKDGMISFEGLKPGKYLLTEEEPAPGYEKANTDWIVWITTDGKAHIKDNNTNGENSLNAALSVKDGNAANSANTNNLFANPLRAQSLESSQGQAKDTNPENGLEDNLNLEIGDDLVGSPLRAGSDWEVVDPNRSEGKQRRKDADKADKGLIVDTKIIEIDKSNKKYRQVFIFPPYDNNVKRNREIKFHVADNKYGLTKNETSITTYTVPDETSLNNINSMEDIEKLAGKADISRNINFTEVTETVKKLKTTSVNTRFNSYVLMVVETSYDPNNLIGLGVNYTYNTNNLTYSKNWLEESYPNEGSINQVRTYKIDYQTPQNGTVEVPTSANVGDRVTIKATPNTGYEIDNVVVRSGQGTVQVTDNTFIMPESDVVVDVSFKAKTFKVDFQTPQNGTVQVPTSAKPGDTVTITATPDSGYMVDTIKVNSGLGPVEVKGNTFVMPASKVVVDVTFKLKPVEKYNVIIEQMKNGSVTAEPTSQEAGKTVNLTVTPNNGYKLGTLTVKDSTEQTVHVNNNSFTMPKGDVTVTATFVEDPEVLGYKVNINQNIENGFVTASPTSAKKGETVTLTAKANVGYELDKFTVTDSKGNNVGLTNNSFTMPASAVTVTATFKKVDMGQEIPEKGFAQITNKQTGLDFKLTKEAVGGGKLQNAEFGLVKFTDNTYETVDKIFGNQGKVRGISDRNGEVKFKDQDGNEISLPIGYYRLTEEISPSGYKKAQAPWNIEVYESKDGQLKAKYNGPELTPDKYTDSDKSYENTKIQTAGNGIKYKSKLTYINTESKTYNQRIYIDTRGYTGVSDKINIQITPKYKRDEIDFVPGPGGAKPPVTIDEGVKTAYRLTYKISGTPTGDENSFANEVLNRYDLSKNNVSMLNTARWRPFDWGFDEDIMNLEKGNIYFIDIEGFYDDSIIDGTATNEVKVDEKYNVEFDSNGKPVKKDPYKKGIPDEDLKKLDLYIDFYDGERFFQQAKTVDSNGNITEWTDGTSIDDAYLLGNVVLGYVAEENGRTVPTTEGLVQEPGEKYPNWLGKKGGRIYKPLKDSERTRVESRIDLSPLYSSNKTNIIPDYGMIVKDEDEVYNITFSKHGRDNKNDPVDGANVTNNRLEGAIFKLQEEIGTNWEDTNSVVGSAFNGYFGFRGLKPGRYRLLEVQAPKGYKPITDPLLHFTIKTVKTNTGEVVDPETGNIINIKSVNVRFTTGGTTYPISDLYMVDPKDDNNTIKISDVKAEEIDIEKALIVNPGTQAKVPLQKLIIVGEEKTVNGETTRKEYPVSQIKIVPGSSGYISLEYDNANGVYQYVPENKNSPEDGKLIDFVTSATAKNMGKIVNERPERGKLSLSKVDENNQSLKGAKFRLTNIATGKSINKNGEDIKDNAESSFTVDNDGKLSFENLEIGNYRLEELQSPEGHINTDQEWNFTIGGEIDPFANDNIRNPKDISDSITLDESNIKVLRPEGSDNTGNDVIKPHESESIIFTNTFKVKEGTKVNPGDFFTIKLSDNINLDGLIDAKPAGLDIIENGVGTVAKADYNKADNTVTYTFTRYASIYPLDKITNKFRAFINLDKVKKSDNLLSKQKVGLGIGDDTTKYNNIKVQYDLDVDRADDGQNNLNLSSKIVKYNPQTGEFTHYYYINRDKKPSGTFDFIYSPYQDVNSLNIERIKLTNNSNIDTDMPESFAIDEESQNMTKRTMVSRYSVKAGEQLKLRFEEGVTKDDSYIIKVRGYVAGANKSSYIGYGKLVKPFANKEDLYVERKDDIYGFTDQANGEKEVSITAINPSNMISFKKIDTEGNTIAGAGFELKIKNGDSLEKVGNTITTTDTGLIEFKELKPGEYELHETKVPNGYKAVDNPVAKFTVDKRGDIYRIEKSQDNEQSEIKVKEPGVIPNLIENIKEHEIEFKKVDAENNATTLVGAEFEVWYKANESDKDYTKLRVYEKTEAGKTDRIVLKDGDSVPNGYTKSTKDKIISGTDGKLGFKFYDPGYYALKETKAPNGYGKPRDFVYEFRLVGGKIQTKQTEGDSENYEDIDSNNPINIENKKSTFPLTGGNGVFIGFAIIGTAVMLTALAYFGIYQNDKNRRRSARYKE